MMSFLDGLIKMSIIMVWISLTLYPEETGKLWRAKYDSFMVGWNSK